VGRPALILAALAADASPGKNFRHYLKVDSNPDLETLRLWGADGQAYDRADGSSIDASPILKIAF
jgi:hypothetical protein